VGGIDQNYCSHQPLNCARTASGEFPETRPARAVGIRGWTHECAHLFYDVDSLNILTFYVVFTLLRRLRLPVITSRPGALRLCFLRRRGALRRTPSDIQ